MTKMKNFKNEDSNIGINTKWDLPEVNPNAGSTLPKPPKFLSPQEKSKE